MAPPRSRNYTTHKRLGRPVPESRANASVNIPNFSPGAKTDDAALRAAKRAWDPEGAAAAEAKLLGEAEDTKLQYAKDQLAQRFNAWAAQPRQPEEPQPLSAKDALAEKFNAWVRGERVVQRPDPFDPETNIRAGVGYVGEAWKRHKGDIDLTLADHITGAGNIAKAGGDLTKVPDAADVAHYLKKVKGYYQDRKSGKITPTEFDEAIERYAKEEGLDPDLIHAIIQQESGYDPKAVSEDDARGLMQLKPENWTKEGRERLGMEPTVVQREQEVGPEKSVSEVATERAERLYRSAGVERPARPAGVPPETPPLDAMQGGQPGFSDPANWRGRKKGLPETSDAPLPKIGWRSDTVSDSVARGVTYPHRVAEGVKDSVVGLLTMAYKTWIKQEKTTAKTKLLGGEGGAFTQMYSEWGRPDFYAEPGQRASDVMDAMQMGGENVIPAFTMGLLDFADHTIGGWFQTAVMQGRPAEASANLVKQLLWEPSVHAVEGAYQAYKDPDGFLRDFVQYPADNFFLFVGPWLMSKLAISKGKVIGRMAEGKGALDLRQGKPLTGTGKKVKEMPEHRLDPEIGKGGKLETPTTFEPLFDPRPPRRQTIPERMVESLTVNSLYEMQKRGVKLPESMREQVRLFAKDILLADKAWREISAEYRGRRVGLEWLSEEKYYRSPLGPDVPTVGQKAQKAVKEKKGVEGEPDVEAKPRVKGQKEYIPYTHPKMEAEYGVLDTQRLRDYSGAETYGLPGGAGKTERVLAAMDLEARHGQQFEKTQKATYDKEGKLLTKPTEKEAKQVTVPRPKGKSVADLELGAEGLAEARKTGKSFLDRDLEREVNEARGKDTWILQELDETGKPVGKAHEFYGLTEKDVAAVRKAHKARLAAQGLTGKRKLRVTVRPGKRSYVTKQGKGVEAGKPGPVTVPEGVRGRDTGVAQARGPKAKEKPAEAPSEARTLAEEIIAGERQPGKERRQTHAGEPGVARTAVQPEARDWMVEVISETGEVFDPPFRLKAVTAADLPGELAAIRQGLAESGPRWLPEHYGEKFDLRVTDISKTVKPKPTGQPKAKPKPVSEEAKLAEGVEAAAAERKAQAQKIADEAKEAKPPEPKKAKETEAAAPPPKPAEPTATPPAEPGKPTPKEPPPAPEAKPADEAAAAAEKEAKRKAYVVRARTPTGQEASVRHAEWVKKTRQQEAERSVSTEKGLELSDTHLAEAEAHYNTMATLLGRESPHALKAKSVRDRLKEEYFKEDGTKKTPEEVAQGAFARAREAERKLEETPEVTPEMKKEALSEGDYKYDQMEDKTWQVRLPIDPETPNASRWVSTHHKTKAEAQQAASWHRRKAAGGEVITEKYFAQRIPFGRALYPRNRTWDPSLKAKPGELDTPDKLFFQYERLIAERMGLVGKIFGWRTRKGKDKAFAGSVLGFYDPLTWNIRLKYFRDLETLSHEFGHWLQRHLFEEKQYDPKMKGAPTSLKFSEFVAKDQQMYEEMLRLSYVEASSEHMKNPHVRETILKEGFAEFMRLYVFDIKTLLGEGKSAEWAAPKFLAWFDKKLASQEKELYAALKHMRWEVQRWNHPDNARARNAAARVWRNSKAGKRKVNERAKYLPSFADFQYHVIDNMHWLKTARDAVNRERTYAGMPLLRPSEDFAVLANHIRGNWGRADRFLNDTAVDALTYAPLPGIGSLESNVRRGKEAGIDFHELVEFMDATHGIELGKRKIITGPELEGDHAVAIMDLNTLYPGKKDGKLFRIVEGKDAEGRYTRERVIVEEAKVNKERKAKGEKPIRASQGKEIIRYLRDPEKYQDTLTFREGSIMDISEGVLAWQDSLLLYAQKGGLFTIKNYNVMKKNNRMYIPYHRLLEKDAESLGLNIAERAPRGTETRYGGAGMGNLPKGVKAFKGGSYAARADIAESLVLNAYTLVNLAERNMAMNAMVDAFASINARPQRAHAARLGQLLEGPLDMKGGRGDKYAVPLSEMRKQFEEALSPETLASLEKDGLNFDALADSFTPSIQVKKPYISVMRKGKPEVYQLHEGLYDAVQHMNKEAISNIVKLASLPAAWLRSGATVFNPEFWVKNVMRDTIAGLAWSEYGFRPGKDSALGFSSAIKRDQFFQEYMTGGGSQATLASMDRLSLSRHVKDVIGDMGIGEKQSFFATVGPRALEGARRYSEVGEMATRLGEFRRAREKLIDGERVKYEKYLEDLFESAPNKDELVRMNNNEIAFFNWLEEEGRFKDILIEGARAGRKVTLDFARKGHSMKNLGQMAAFLTANINGYDRTIRELFRKERKAQIGKGEGPSPEGKWGAWQGGGGVVTRMAIGITGITVSLMALRRLYNMNEEYKKIPVEERNLFWHVPIPKTAQGLIKDQMGIEVPWFRIPKPHEMGILFGSSLERYVDWLEAEHPHTKDELNSILSEMVFGQGSRLVPTIASPFVENYANYSMRFGRPIVPRGKIGLLPQYQHGPSTTASMRVLGRIAGYSPSKIENVVSGWTGGAGKNLSLLMSGMMYAVGAQGETPTPQMADVSMARAFFSRTPPTSTADVNRFYNMKTDIDEAWASYRAKLKTGQREQAKEILEENKPIFKYRGIVNSAEKQMAKMRKRIYSLQDIDYTGPRTPRQRREEIDMLRTRMGKLATKAMKAMK